MNHTRRWTFLGIALTLMISACSQAPVVEGGLEPQYGTALSDSGLRVATNEAGHLYTLGTIADDYLETSETVLKRFDTTGSERWSRKLGLSCAEGEYRCYARGYGVGVDTGGNGYALHGKEYGASVPTRETTFMDATLKKYSPSGGLLWMREVYAGTVIGGVAMATTSTGETFVAYRLGRYEPSESDDIFVASYRLVKYSSSGAKLFDKTQVIDEPSDAAVASDGSLYLVGNGKAAKYRGDGTLIWQRTLPVVFRYAEEQVAVNGSHVYISLNTGHRESESRIALYKYTAGGALQWTRTITPFGTAYMSGLSADASGNAYLTGATNPDYTGPSADTLLGYDLFVRKYTPSGSIAWTYAPKLPGTYEAARDVSAAASGKVYVVGETTGKVNGKNYGGQDAFLLRLDTAGKKVWSR